jgi:hypothetical protein
MAAKIYIQKLSTGLRKVLMHWSILRLGCVFGKGKKKLLFLVNFIKMVPWKFYVFCLDKSWENYYPNKYQVIHKSVKLFKNSQQINMQQILVILTL